MLAAIDVGSNTVRMLLGTIRDGKVLPTRYVRRITRLKGGQTEAGLAVDAMNRTLTVLKEFSELLAEQAPCRIRAVATEALRSAANSDSFLARVERETGLTLEVVDGIEEARLSATGVTSVLDTDPAQTLLIFDIGGGSTEFILLQRTDILFQRSLKLGVVDLMESLAAGGRQSAISASIDSVFISINEILQQLPSAQRQVTLVGTAGTVTTLAALEMQMLDYDWRRVNGYEMHRHDIEQRYEQLLSLPLHERERLPGMEPGRGDLIIAGIEIIREIMQRLRTDVLLVSDFGLLEGILLSMPSMSASNR